MKLLRLFVVGFLFVIFPIMANAKDIDWASLNPDLADAQYVSDPNKCVKCHADYMATYARTIHAKVFKFGGKGDLAAKDCEVCHGPMSKHLDAPRNKPPLTVTFRLDAGVSAQQLSAICTQCHEGGQRMHWQGSPHEMAGIGCSGCHYVMEKKSLDSLFINEDPKAACLRCHKEKRAELMRSSHMPLREGKMDCASCHNPHGGPGPNQLKFATVNEVCYECHQDKRGPFLWEHAPVRENCANCHDPHGSNNEAMLIIKNPYLCQSCHSASGHPSVLYDGNRLPGGTIGISTQLVGKGCLNCHSLIHGSNHPSGARFQR